MAEGSGWQTNIDVYFLKCKPGIIVFPDLNYESRILLFSLAFF